MAVQIKNPLRQLYDGTKHFQGTQFLVTNTIWLNKMNSLEHLVFIPFRSFFQGTVVRQACSKEQDKVVLRRPAHWAVLSTMYWYSNRCVFFGDILLGCVFCVGVLFVEVWFNMGPIIGYDSQVWLFWNFGSSQANDFLGILKWFYWPGGRKIGFHNSEKNLL